MKVHYKNYLIERKWVSKGDPQPDEWVYEHVEYDGPEDYRCGFCETFDACKREIDDLIRDTDDVYIEDFDILDDK